MSNKSNQLLVIGLLLIVLGAIFKVFKMEVYSNTILIIGLLLEIIAGIIFFYSRVSLKKR